jgi:hypothetical protein
MWLYWTLFLIPAIAGLSGTPPKSATARVGYWAFAGVLTLVIGLRFEVGQDWFNYLRHIDDMRGLAWTDAIARVDPAYFWLNWVAAETGRGAWVVNLPCALLFVAGFFAFSRRLRNPWLAIAVGVPYMALVLSINYTRQGAALGLIFFALMALEDGRSLRFAVCVAVAATFHSSAAVLMPLGLLANTPRKFWLGLAIVASSVIVYFIFLAEIQSAVLDNYLGQGMSSEGSGVRIAMNAMAAAVFLFIRREPEMPATHRRLWTWFAVLSLLLVPALYLSPSSTAVDRLALYFIPMQLVAFSWAPFALRRDRLGVLPSLGVVLGYGAVLFVWFTFSAYRAAWVPYHFYPLQGL